MSSFVHRACAAFGAALLPLTVVLSFAPGEVAATEYPGAIPAKFSVGDQGEARYVIPIDAPAATGGIRPNVALAYNHLAGLGAAGVGWSLSGGSAITRCNHTYLQDGALAGFIYDGSTDPYCLDGQRLVAYSGDHGESGTEYRTELETFQRIFQYGELSGTGPESFYVKHGDGRTSYYGYTADSQIAAVGPSGVRAWYLSYTEDQYSNRISYVYSENTTTGEVLLSEVNWTSNAGQGLSSKYKIAITYETAPSDTQRFAMDAGGAVVLYSQRIDKIDVIYNGWTTVSTYDLSYHTPSSGGTGRSQLASVTLCRGSDCLPATTFQVQDGTAGWNAQSDTGASVGSWGGAHIGDMNGDGRDDLFVVISGDWHVYLGTTGGSFSGPIDTNVRRTTASSPKPRATVFRKSFPLAAEAPGRFTRTRPRCPTS